MRFNFIAAIVLILASGCSQTQKEQTSSAEHKIVGEIIANDDQLWEILPKDAKLEVIADGYDWSEGPLWLADQEKLIWSDVPRNTIYQWTENSGVSVFLNPSGYTTDKPRGGEMGSNGLLLDDENQLILCQHGDRRIARMVSQPANPSPVFETVADRFDGKKFNSPNDAAFGPGGNLYFTDPPYGLEGQMTDASKELDFQGVFKITTSGEVTVITKSLTRPNGIAFSPDGTKCYVANSDPDHAVWMIYDVDDQGDLINERLFFDATSMVKNDNGLPDGMKINKEGILFATGPGGVFVFTPEGKHLGTIHSGSPISNCAFNEDETVLFMTSDAMILRIGLNNLAN